MSIRSSAKALIIKNKKLLLINNSSSDEKIGDFYCLPGGGQHKYESLFEAVVRECKEETGYEVQPIKLIGLCEEICTDEKYRAKHPDYAHKVYHIFLCELMSDKAEIPGEKDGGQVGIEWIDIDTLNSIRLLPKGLGDKIVDIVNGIAPVFLGSELTKFNNG